MTAPWIVARISDHTRADRIEVDVAHESKQVALRIDQSGTIAPLEKVPGRWYGSLQLAGVARGDDAHQVAERRVGDLDRKVDVIRHPAVGDQARPVAVERLGQDRLEAQVVVAIAENGLAVIASQHGMVQTAADVQATLSWHRTALPWTTWRS